MEAQTYQLNEGQQAAFDWLLKFCLRKTDFRKALLTGYAGTGKTFLINRVIEQVRTILPDLRFGMTAPTHKAVKALKKGSELKHLLTFGTIHSFLALKEVINEKGKVEFKPDFNPDRERKIDQIHILIVDESSMLQDELFEYIENEQRSNPYLLVIYMGDPLQIPPIRNDEEKKAEAKLANLRDAIPFIPAQQQSRRIHVLSLTEPQRQSADSPIIMYAHEIRRQAKNAGIEFDFKDEYKHALELVPRSKAQLRSIFGAFFMTPQFEADPDYFKVICWRNETIDYFNNEIRLLMHNATELPKYLLGEKLIMGAPLVKGDKVIIANSDEVVITSLEIKEVPINYRMKRIVNVWDKIADDINDIESELKTWTAKVYKVTLETSDEDSFPAIILHEDSERMYTTIREQMNKVAKDHPDQFARKEMWKQYYALERKFAWVKYNYCISSHKSQGSTYDHALIMEWDIDQNWSIEERNRIRYVANTRARHKNFIIR